MKILDMKEQTLAFDKVPKDDGFRSSSHEMTTLCTNEVCMFSHLTIRRRQCLTKAAGNRVVYCNMRSNSNSKNGGIRRP